MSGIVATTAGRLRLALVLGSPIALLLVSTADASPAPILAVVAVAAMAALVGRHLRVTTSTNGLPAPSPGVTNQPRSSLAGRVTDPRHHPLRPRAPGLA